MTINEGCYFIFADEHCSTYGVIMASAIGSVTRSGNIENRSIITTKNINNIFNLHGIQYDEPLSFDIIIYNEDASWIDANEERMLKKWILKNKMNWLEIDQDDISNVRFWCIAKSAELIDIGTYTGGMKITFQADSPHAYSDLKTKNYTCTSTSSFNLFMDLDFDEYTVLPNIKVTPLTNDSTISIKNNTTNEIVEFYHCLSTEIIFLECQSDKISSSNGRLMIDNWNKSGLSLIQGSNNFTLTGNFQLSLEYRLPIRVGA